MSNDSLSVSPSPEVGQEAAPLDWLLALLREAMVEVMADDTPPLKKANALARLGSLYLKTYNTAALARVNVELVERVAELEGRLTAAGIETAAGQANATGLVTTKGKGSPTSSRTGKAKRAKPRPHGRPRSSRHRPSRPSPRGKTARRS